MVSYKLIYDGDCGICSWSALWVKAHDKKDIFEIVMSQEIDLEKLSNKLTDDVAQKTVILVNNCNHKIYIEASAVFQILRNLNGIYKLAGILLSNHFFSILFRPVYRLIAVNRAFISSKLGLTACKVK